MSEAVSRGQALEVSARVATQVNWDELDGDKLQVEIISLSPAEFGSRFTAFLKNGGQVIQVVVGGFPIWKTIKLGTGLKTADEFHGALDGVGFHIGDWGNDVLGKPAFKVSPKETSIELVRVTVAELGFEYGTTCTDIYKRAIELGLELCPNEVGPQLRLQYKDQPKGGERLLIAMEPITVSNGILSVFAVGHDRCGLWLDGCYGSPGRFWNADCRWVFTRRK